MPTPELYLPPGTTVETTTRTLRGMFLLPSWPARHDASGLTGSQYPPMGQRFRLKAGFYVAG